MTEKNYVSLGELDKYQKNIFKTAVGRKTIKGDPHIADDRHALMVAEKLGIYDGEIPEYEQNVAEVSNAVVEGLYPHQQVAHDWLVENRRALLADDTGLGKTRTVLEYVKTMGFENVLVVAPAYLLDVWSYEIETWTKFDSVKLTSKNCDSVMSSSDTIFLVSYQTARRLSSLCGYGSINVKPSDKTAKVLNRPWDCLILDEAHAIKSPKALQTRACWSIGDTANSIVALTGTPISNSLEDFWSLLRLLNPKVWTSKTAFVNFFGNVVPNFFGGFDVVGLSEANREILDDVIGSYVLRRLRDDVLDDLPDVVRNRIVVPMTSAQTKQYKMVKDRSKVLDGENVSVCSEPIVKVTRMHQAAQAELKVVSDEEVELTNKSKKLDYLVEHVRSLGEDQIVIFSHSAQLAKLASLRLLDRKIYNGLIVGAVDQEVRTDIISKFQNGSIQIIVASLACISEGVTLSAAKHGLFLQRSFNFVQNYQSEARMRRIGSTHDNIFITDFVTAGTVDEVPFKALETKSDNLRELMHDPRKLLEFDYENMSGF